MIGHTPDSSTRSAIFPDINLLFRTYFGIARFNFFSANSTITDAAVTTEGVNPLQIVAAVVAFTGVLYRQLFGLFTDGLLLMGCLTLWFPAKIFSSLVAAHIVELEALLDPQSLRNLIVLTEEQHIFHVHKISKNYDSLKELCKLVNDTFSLVLLLYMTEALFSYSINLNAIFLYNFWIQRARLIAYMLSFIGMLMISGDIGLQVCINNSHMQINIILQVFIFQISKLNEWVYLVNKLQQRIKHTRIRFNKNICIVDVSQWLDELSSNSVIIHGVIFVMDYATVFSVSILHTYCTIKYMMYLI